MMRPILVSRTAKRDTQIYIAPLNEELQRRLVTGQSGDVRLELNMWIFRCFLKVFRVLQCTTSGGKSCSMYQVQSMRMHVYQSLYA